MTAKAEKPKAEKPVRETKPVVEKQKEVNPPVNPPEHSEAPIENDSIAANSAQVTENSAAEARADDSKDDAILDPHDGAQLDQNTGAVAFDEKAEKKAAHAKAPEVPEHVKHAVVNPNGTGVEWPR